MAENRGHRLWPRQNKKRGYNGKISGVKSSRIKSTLELLGCDQYPHSLFKNKHYSTLTDEPFQFLVYYEQREGREWGGVQYLTTKICSRKRFLSPTSLQDISFKSSPCIRCGNGFVGFVFFALLRFAIKQNGPWINCCYFRVLARLKQIYAAVFFSLHGTFFTT